MNITFMIGNGFDLNLGLDTSYSDFLEEYRRPQPEDSELIRQFKRDILENNEHWSSAELAFGKYTKKFDNNERTVDDFCECHEHFCESLAKYLRRQAQRIDTTNWDNTLLERFAKSLTKFDLGLREAQREEIKNAMSTYNGGYVFNFLVFNYTSTLSSLVQAVKGLGILGQRAVRNNTYSNAFGSIIHVHGTTEHDMVLGVNDETQIENTDLFSGVDQYYIDQIIKPHTNKINEEHTDKKADELLGTSDFIYIYGMSIGDTDAIWWERLCNLMKSKSKLHVVIFAHNAPDDGLIRRKYLQFEREKRESIVRFSVLSEEVNEDIMRRIHISKANIFEDLKDIAEDEIFVPSATEIAEALL